MERSVLAADALLFLAAMVVNASEADDIRNDACLRELSGLNALN